MPAQSVLIYPTKAAIFGSGAFGTAMSTPLAKKCKEVCVWHMDQAEADLINQKRENTFFLPGARLADNVQFTANVEATWKDAEVILFAIPTQHIRAFMQAHAAKMLEYIQDHRVPVVVCSEGIERDTLKFPEQIISEFLPRVKLSVLAGPSFAIEVANSTFTSVSVCNRSLKEARKVQYILTTPDHSFLCFASADIVGAEVASAIKNVLAIGAGVATGLGMGLDARAALIARGLIEIRDMTKALNSDGAALFGLPGLGDLLLTCSSELSRNFTVGQRLGKGESLEEIQRTSKAVAEGLCAAEPLMRFAEQHKVELPICSLIYRVVSGQLAPKEAAKHIISHPLRDEGLPKLFNFHNTTSKL